MMTHVTALPPYPGLGLGPASHSVMLRLCQNVKAESSQAASPPGAWPSPPSCFALAGLGTGDHQNV
jgi:hypothetical protein